MNNWLYKMERRFGRYGIPNLAKYLALGQLVVWVIVMFFYGDLLGLITLSRSGLMHGQIWRLVTFVFVPPSPLIPCTWCWTCIFCILWVPPWKTAGAASALPCII